MKGFKKFLELPYLFVLPTLVILFGIAIFPLLYSIYLTVMDINLSKPQYGVHFVGFQQFVELTKDSAYVNSLYLTFVLSATVVIVETAVGLFVALLYSQIWTGRDIIRTLTLIPMILTPVAVGLLWRYMYQPVYGILNYLMVSVGLPSGTWHSEPSTALLSVAIIDVWQWTPFAILVLTAGLQSLPVEPFEAAQIDGASRWQTFRNLTLPLLKPVILVVVIIRGLDSLKIFDTIDVLTKGGRGLSTQVFNMNLYKEGFAFFKISYAAAGAWPIFLISILFSYALFRELVRKK